MMCCDHGECIYIHMFFFMSCQDDGRWRLALGPGRAPAQLVWSKRVEYGRMDYEEDASRELIKCVVVGDTGVGKTRLICAKACGQKPTLEQLINVHVPTVWAIDQYRICRDVLERSYEVVDGINIALRIWDTFGDHHNDRCFAYGRSDVVLICYSVASSRSLEHAKTVWYPEIRRQRPNVPILLVGCKNDLRYLCQQPEFQRMLAERRPSPLKLYYSTSTRRPIHGDNIVSPEQGRAAAKEIGAFYYEASVLTRFGVEETFQNAVRAALCRRRQGRLWSGHFQCVKFPQVQAPFLPPKPSSPAVNVLSSCYVEQMTNLISVQSTNSNRNMDEGNQEKETYFDCVLRLGEQLIMAHKLILASASKMFRGLFVCDEANCQMCLRDIDAEYACPSESTESLLIEKSDKELLLDTEEDDDSDDVEVFCLPVLHRPNGCGGSNGAGTSSNHTNSKDGNSRRHKRGRSVDMVSTRNPNGTTKSRHATVGGDMASSNRSTSDHSIHAKSIATAIARGLPDCVLSISEDFRRRNNLVIIPLAIVTLRNDLSVEAVLGALEYMYCGQLHMQTMSTHLPYYGQSNTMGNLNRVDLLKVADAFGIESLREMLMEREGQLVSSVGPLLADSKFLADKNANLVKMGVEMGLFSDVKFVLEDGVVRAQKFLLCARCDVMRAMFRSAFRESCTSEVTLPGITVEALRLFLTYLITDSVSYHAEHMGHSTEYIEALELANRMCVPRLVTVIEKEIVEQLERLEVTQELNTEEVLLMLEPAQMCNAQQLVSWCFHYLCCNYSRVCDQCGKLMKTMLPSNQDYIAKHRWPPLWYLKEYDYHEKIVREGQRAAEAAANKLLKRTRTSGCLCFSSKTSTRLQHNSI